MRISDWSSDVCSSDLPCDGLPIHDRGLAYGDGLFETIRVAGGQARLVERHLQRLQDGCERLAIPVDANLLRNELMRFCRALGQGVAKLIVTSGAGQARKSTRLNSSH